jgi:hypothetical protein
MVSESFIALLILLGQHRSDVSLEYLLEKGWNESSAEAVMEVLEKNGLAT